MRYDSFPDGEVLCTASRHALVNNCLSCGKIVCMREGPGPCFFCGMTVAAQRTVPAPTYSEGTELLVQVPSSTCRERS